MPAEFAVTCGVARVSAPIVPEPESKVRDAEPVMVEEAEIAPAPVAVSETAVPETAELTAMPLLAPLLVKVSVPVAVIVLEMVIAVAAAAVSVKLKLAPVEGSVPVSTWVSVKVTLPVVLAPRAGVAKLNGPMFAEPVAKAMELEPVIVPVAEIMPVPVAVIVSAVPETLALIAMGLLLPVSINARVPVAVMVLVILIPPAAESVKLKAAPVEAPLPVIA